MGEPFLTRPIDYRALRTVLATLLVADARADVHAVVTELQIMVEEAERAERRDAWDERILARWAEFESLMRRPRGA